MIDDATKTRILEALQARYGSWSGFQDEQFIKDETGYKRQVAAATQPLIARSVLDEMVQQGQWDDFIAQLELAGKRSINLLYMRTPKSGDLKLLYAPALEGELRAAFCRAFFQLLYGGGSAPERLGDFVAFLETNKLPIYWTFPTYFLFISDPDHNLLVKPSTIHSFLKFIGSGDLWSTVPTTEGYQTILDTAAEVGAALKEYGQADLIDVQSVMYVCADVERGNVALKESASRKQHPGVFKSEAFALLKDLEGNPTVAFCQAHQTELHDLVVAPFQRVLHQVAKRLSEQMIATLETEKYLFSAFAKNDYGRGGAWPHYWGAFYPGGSKRSRNAQLLMVIRHDMFKAGFHIGNYGSSQRERLTRNCQGHRGVLEPILVELLGDDVHFGPRETLDIRPGGNVTYLDGSEPTWADFLQDPSRFNNDVSYFLAPEDLVELEEDALIERVLDSFRRLFPLVLLATLDEPLIEIEAYVAQEFPELDEEEAEDAIAPVLPMSDISAKTGFAQTELVCWVAAIQRKQQAIFYGPPGTGKTFIARMLAQHLIGGGDGFWELVQFHPAYAYEDFIQGIRPQPMAGGGLTYPVLPGRFLDFCQRAVQRKGPCVLIIDEINRANLARVFGELMYLLEYRDESIKLAAKDQGFRIPRNVFLIGTMNTADRSIALVDHALRRRFAFIKLEPQYTVLGAFHQKNGAGFDPAPLIEVLREINRQIGDPHYAVGISFFLRDALAGDLEDIWRMEIEPYLEEYFFDQRDLVKKFSWEQVAPRLLPDGQSHG